MLLIVDLECTCCGNGEFPREEMEIIEIGAVMYRGGVIRDGFTILARPVFNPILTDYCKDLTGISQEEVDTAPLLEGAMNAFKEWFDRYSLDEWGSWGMFDHRIFNGLRPSLNVLRDVPHVNLKSRYQDHTGLRGRGVQKALRQQNLEFEGAHHRAYPDARNIARIMAAAENMDQ